LPAYPQVHSKRGPVEAQSAAVGPVGKLVSIL